MVLERSPVSKTQIGPDTALGTSPVFPMYLLACEVEDKSPNTVATYKQRVGKFLNSTFPLEERDITPDHIRHFLYSLKQEGLCLSTVNAYYRVIQTYFNWLIAEGLLTKSPMSNVKSPKIPQTLPMPFSLDDIRALLRETSRPRFLDARNRAIVLVFLDTGIRLAEMARLKVVDVDLKRGMIKVFGKGSKERIVAIQKGTQKALLHYLLMRTDVHDALWVNEERRPMTRAGIRVTVVKLCQRASITDAKCGPHTFRHTAAIHCLRNGMHEFTLQLMLGHSTLAMTRRYVSSLGAEDVLREHKMASPVDNLFKE